jgi:hypothetical protein
MADHFCWICGFPLETHQIAAEFDGRICDYVLRVHGTVSFIMCDECWKEFQRKASGGVELARVRAELVLRQDNEDMRGGVSYC